MQIKLTASFGNQVKQIILEQPSGAPGIYHIMIDNYYYGQVVRDPEGWRVALQREGNPEWMTEDDKEMIVEAVNKTTS